MADMIPRLVMGALVIVHLFLAAWAVVGLVEFFAPTVPWPRIANPLFPDWVLLAQWLLILPTATVFLVGYAVGWPSMPLAVTIGYAGMAALCAYQTVTLLQHDLRYVAMVAEYAAYVAIALFLFRSDYVQARLSGLS